MWVRKPENDLEGFRTYLNQFSIGKVTFWLWMTLDVWNNAHISLSSGVKRKHKYTFEDKGVKNPPLGLAPLKTIRDLVLGFEAWYNERHVDKLRSITVGASDSRRRRIYTRALVPYGFRVIHTKLYGIVLYKKF